MDAEQYFAVIPEWVIQTTSPRALQVYALLRRHADYRKGSTYVGLNRLAEEAGTTRQTIRRAIEELVEVGAVTVEQRFHGNRQTTNLYTLRTTRGGIKNVTLPPIKNDTPPGIKNDTPLISSPKINSPKIKELARRPTNPIWDTLAMVLGNPTKAQTGLQGSLVKELGEAGIPADELARIMERIVIAWGAEKLTLGSVAKHWSRFRDGTPAAQVPDARQLKRSADTQKMLKLIADSKGETREH